METRSNQHSVATHLPQPPAWKQVATAIVLAVSTFFGAISAAEPQRFSAAEPHMGVEYEIVLFADNEAAAKDAQRAAFDRIEALNGVLSDYDSTSEAMKLSASAPHEQPIAVGADLRTMLGVSCGLYDQSAGAFDITIGPVTKIWRRARRQRELPSEAALNAAQESVGGDAIESTADGVRLRKLGMRLDFGGIAKGHAAEESLQVLKAKGFKQALVRGSGDIAAGDPPPDAAGWKVAIAPLNPDDKPTEYLTLANACVSTSGDARQNLVVDGKRYSHIIDPRTGRPVEGRSSVTVVAPHGHIADGWATALSVLGPAGFERLKKIPGAAAMMVVERDGRTSRHETKNFGPTQPVD